MRWQISSATLMLWVDRKTVVPLAASERNRSLSVRAPLGSMPTIGSSMIRMLRLMNQCAADDQTLFHAVRVAFNQLVFPRREFQVVEQLGACSFQPR